MQQATVQPITSDQRQTTVGTSRAYRRLVVWQKADELAYQIYHATKAFPEDERFGLVSQMRRASVSVAANIVEGYTRSSSKERVRFYEISRGSLTELEYYIDFVYTRLKYIDEETFGLLDSLRQEVGRLLHGFLKSEK